MSRTIALGVVGYVIGIACGWLGPLPHGATAIFGLGAVAVAVELVEWLGEFHVSWSRTVLFTALCLLFGWLRVGWILLPPPEAALLPQSGRDGSRPAVLTGRLTESPTKQGEVWRVTLCPDWVGWSRARVRLSLQRLPTPAPRVGDSYRVRCRLVRAASPMNPGEPSRARGDALQGVYATGWVGDSRDLVRIPGGALTPWKRWSFAIARALGSCREAARVQFLRGMAPQDAAVLLSLVVGDESLLEPRQRWALERAGIVHLISVSGLHVGMMAALPALLLRPFGLSPVAICVVSMALASVYAAIAGFEPAVTRALIMLGVVTIATVVRRRVHATRTLCLTAVVMLVADPKGIFRPGFQLSFAATAGLIAASRVIRILPQAHGHLARAARWCTASLLMSLGAQVATLPLAVWHFGGVSVVSPAVNLIAVPLSTGAVQFGVAGSAFGGPFWPIRRLFFRISALLCRTIMLLATAVGAMPGSYLTVGRVAVVLLPVLAAISWLGYSAARVHKWRALVTICGVSVLVLTVGSWCWRGLDRRLEVTFLAVGSGTAVHLRLPGSRDILVDTGRGAGDDGWTSRGDGVVVPYLRRRGISSLQGVVLTHTHSDHAGGLDGVLRSVRTGWIVVPESGAADLRRRMITPAKGRSQVVVASGRRALRYPAGVVMEVFGPAASPGSTTMRWAGGGSQRGNEESLTLVLSYGRFRLIMSGDREPRLELIPGGRATVMEVPHHGSRYLAQSLAPELLRPALGVVSVGPNSYGHPAIETLRRWEGAGAKVLRTDVGGAVTIKTDGVGYSVRRWARVDPYWLIPTGDSALRRTTRLRDVGRH